MAIADYSICLINKCAERQFGNHVWICSVLWMVKQVVCLEDFNLSMFVSMVCGTEVEDFYLWMPPFILEA